MFDSSSLFFPEMSYSHLSNYLIYSFVSFPFMVGFWFPQNHILRPSSCLPDVSVFLENISVDFHVQSTPGQVVRTFSNKWSTHINTPIFVFTLIHQRKTYRIPKDDGVMSLILFFFLRYLRLVNRKYP